MTAPEFIWLWRQYQVQPWGEVPLQLALAQIAQTTVAVNTPKDKAKDIPSLEDFVIRFDRPDKEQEEQEVNTMEAFKKNLEETKKRMQT